MSSTTSKRQHVWICWQEPEIDRGKFSLIPVSWIAKSITGDGILPGSLVLCHWPRSDELFTAKVIHDPTPNDLAQVEVMEVPMFVDESNDNNDSNNSNMRKSFPRNKDRQSTNSSPKVHSSSGGANNSNNNGDDGIFVLGQLKRFFLTEMTKIGGEMQANFDILGHRIGALEVNMKCVRERVERIENILNTAVHDFDTNASNNNQSFLNLQQSTQDNNNGDIEQDQLLAPGRRIKSEPNTSKRSMDSTTVSSKHNMMMAAMENEDEQEDDEEPTQPVVIPRAPEQRVRKDRNPRPRAIVVTCPRNRNIVFLGGDEQYRMPLPTYLDAIRHAKRPTATYMVTALLRRYLPPNTLARLCVNERQLGNTAGGQLVDDELLEALKKQGRMQFPQTDVVDRELMLRIEDVTRDVRRKIKMKKTMASTAPKRSSGGGSSSTPISMVTSQRASLGNMGLISGKGSRSKGFANETSLVTDEGGGRILRLKDSDGSMTLGGGNVDYDDNPQALPMFS